MEEEAIVLTRAPPQSGRSTARERLQGSRFLGKPAGQQL
jgi:hypothetical protein